MPLGLSTRLHAAPSAPFSLAQSDAELVALPARSSLPVGDVFPIHGTCLGFQLLHILEANVSFTELLVDTDSGGCGVGCVGCSGCSCGHRQLWVAAAAEAAVGWGAEALPVPMALRLTRMPGWLAR